MKITVCGNYGVKNAGDEAILEGLRLFCDKAFPGATLQVQGKGNLLPVGLRSFFKAIFKPSLWRNSLRIIKSCDLYILGGGGLFTDEEGPFVSLFWSLHGFFALAYGKPLLCLGISIGKLNFLGKWAAKKLFSQATLISVRDLSSLNLLKKCGIDALLSSDFALEIPVGNKKIVLEEKYAVISVRAAKTFDERMYKIFAQFADWIIEKYAFNIRFIPFHSSLQNDAMIMNKIIDHMTNKSSVKTDGYYDNIHELVNVLRGAEIVFAMRLHAGILALLTQTPFCALSYMSKVDDFWSEFPTVPRISLSEISLKKLQDSYEHGNRLTTEELQRIQKTLTARNDDLLKVVKTMQI